MYNFMSMTKQVHKKPPPRELCLFLAKRFAEMNIKTVQNLSWHYLFCYVMYDYWIEEYWND